MLISITDASRRLRVNRRTVIHWIHFQGLPAYRVGTVWRIDDKEFEKWLEARRINHGST